MRVARVCRELFHVVDHAVLALVGPFVVPRGEEAADEGDEDYSDDDTSDSADGKSGGAMISSLRETRATIATNRRGASSPIAWLRSTNVSWRIAECRLGD